MLKIGDTIIFNKYGYKQRGFIVGFCKQSFEYYAAKFYEKKSFFHSCDGSVEKGYGYYIKECECDVIKSNKYLQFIK